MQATLQGQTTVQATMDAFNRHDAAGFAACYAPEAVALDPQYSEPLRGRDAIRKDIEDFFRSFPDIQGTVGKVIADGDTVALEFTFSGTNKGPIVSPMGELPPTGQRIEVVGSRFVRVNAEGLITECRRYYDMMGFMQQLGLAGEAGG